MRVSERLELATFILVLCTADVTLNVITTGPAADQTV